MSAATPGPRRRAADRPKVRPATSATAAVVVLVIALVAVLLVRPPDAPATTGSGPAAGGLVSRTSFGCPDTTPVKGVATAVGLGLAPAPAGVSIPAAGGLRQGPVTTTGSPLTLPRGHVADVPATGGPAVHAVGGPAVGLFGFRTDTQHKRTLGVSMCAAPRSQWWFTGAGASLDHRSTLVLANVDTGPAVVDLTVLGPGGKVDTVGTEGILLPPRSVKRIPLTDIAPQNDDLAVGVHATQGRVVAAVGDTYSAKASTTPGQDWVAATTLPSRTTRIAGLPAKADAHTLLVANPTDLEAVVQVQVAGRSGSFVPTGLDTISVGAGAVTRVDLTKVLPTKEPVALRLRSRVPVVASVRSTSGRDHSYATPVTPLVGPAAAPVVTGADTSVQLTAGALRATVDLAAYDANGKRVDGTRLAVAPTATASWTPGKGAAYVVVTPSTASGNGPVYGAVSYSGAGLAAVPLTALPILVERPVVAPGLQ